MPSSAQCSACNTTAYSRESVTALGKFFHLRCFKCSVCNTAVNMKNFKGVEGNIYCATHAKNLKSEMGRKKQTTREATLSREDHFAPVAEEDVGERERETETEKEKETEIEERGRERETEEREVPPALVKTTSEIATKDNLITSFVNGAKSREIEVVFAFDTTGSMHSYIQEVRTKLKETCQKLMKDIPSIKIGIMAFGDYCDYSNYVVKYIDLCQDTQKLVDWIHTVGGTGGGDQPEAYELALREAQKLSWTKGDNTNVNKALVVIGDAPPHVPSYTTEKIYWRDELSELVKQGVKVYGVLCNLAQTRIQPFYEELAEESGGVFLTLKHLPLITDMFLAVCYREFGAEHLETFRTEVTDGGRMNEGMENLFTQLEKDAATPNKKIGTRSTEVWYNKDFDKNLQPSYQLNNGKWECYSAKRKNLGSPSPPAKKAKKEVATKPSPVTKPKATKKPKAKVDKKKKETVKKDKKKKVEKEEEEEEEKKPLKKTESVIVGNGEWKRDRKGRLSSLSKD